MGDSGPVGVGGNPFVLTSYADDSPLNDRGEECRLEQSKSVRAPDCLLLPPTACYYQGEEVPTEAGRTTLATLGPGSLCGDATLLQDYSRTYVAWIRNRSTPQPLPKYRIRRPTYGHGSLTSRRMLITNLNLFI